MAARVALGLGGNIGDPGAALEAAVASLGDEPGLTGLRVSPLYRTAPVGGVDQPDFLNAVAVADTDLPPMELLALAHRLEMDAGRTREVRWGPRTLDVDVLAVGDSVSDDSVLTLPHPRAHERAFVLVPWADVDPGFVIVGHGTVAQCLAALPDEDRAGVVPA